MFPIHRDDVWKAWTVIVAILSALAAHMVKLPPAWEHAMPYIEFFSGLGAVVTALFIKPNTGGQA